MALKPLASFKQSRLELTLESRVTLNSSPKTPINLLNQQGIRTPILPFMVPSRKRRKREEDERISVLTVVMLITSSMIVQNVGGTQKIIPRFPLTLLTLNLKEE